MKKIFTLFLVLVATTALRAYDFKEGSLYYSITSSSAPYTVEVADALSSITTATIPKTVTYNDTTYSVTSIGDYAFWDCSRLTSVTIPNSITSIGKGAFGYCSGLTSVTIPNSVTSIGGSAFYECSGLTSVTLPNSVTSIGNNAFFNCSSLTSITIPNSVTSIGNSAFYRCKVLTSVTIPNSVTSIGSSVFKACPGLTSIIIPNSVTSIGSYAFEDCSGLTSVTIPNSVTSIGGWAFEGCSGLTSVTIGSGVTSIGDDAFRDCSSLTSVTINSNDILSREYTSDSNIGRIFGSQVTEYVIGNSVTTIGNYAFDGCKGLTSITIPNSVTSIGFRAFRQCSNLTSITIPNSVTSIGEWAFYSCSSLTSVTINSNDILSRAYTYNANIGTIFGSQVTRYVIGNSVTTIGNYAFDGCKDLTSITIPNSVTSIGDNAFCDCSGLTSITIPNSVTSIGDYAFDGCKGLTSITIPNSVTSIGDNAFRDCSSLTSVTINSNDILSREYTSKSNIGTIFGLQVTRYVIGNSVTTIGNYAFEGCKGLTSVTIGNSVTSIGNYAFRYCSGLTSVVWNAENCADFSSYSYAPFYDICSQITSFTVGDNVEHIPAYLCYGMSNLTSITIPNSLTSIGDYAFYDCSGLTSFTIPNRVTSIGNYAFYDCSGLTSVTIPNRVTSIGNYAFYRCKVLTSVTIPNSVTSIGWGVFYGCSSLTSVTINSNDILSREYTSESNIGTIFGSHVTEYVIGNSVTTIGNYAFEGCSGLTSITIPNSVTSIGGWAFEDCKDLTSITIPNSVTSIGEGVFGWCSGLTSVTIPNSVTSIGDYAFYSCSGLTSITIPNSVTSIGESEFGWCSGLTSITIPNSVTSIGDYAFYDCYSLTSITIPESVNTIGWGVFSGCEALTSITIPNSVTSIGDEAFSGCSGLTSVNVFAEVPPTLGTYVFYNVSKQIPVYVPSCGSVSAYQSAEGWKAFTNIQGPLAEYSIAVGVNDNKMGTTKVDENTICGAQISATANYGYHFTQWSDGNIDNPRTFVLTQDTAFTAEFAPNHYTISTLSSDMERGTISGDVTTTYLDHITITATANYGYHFSHWDDYNYDNPRQVQVTEDKTYIAYFDKNTYYITKNYDSNQGYVNGATSGEYLDNITLIAEPNSAYHFVRWEDGNTDNPRTIILTQDTTFTAEFAINQYSITTTSSHFERGTTQGDATVNYLEYTTISATANYGYHFSSWNDGNTDNPRVVQVTDNKTYTAQFDKNIYKITASCDNQMGSVTALDGAEYLDEITISATANYGYHFSIWNDGNTDNPRTIILTQDTTFTAEFALTYSGQCGDYLYWQYAGTTLAITGAGDMWDDVPWRLFCDSITTVDIAKGATSISESAFANCKKLTKLILPASMEEIGANAFAECKKLYDIYSYAEDPPTANESSFANYNAYLYIPCESQRYYKADMVFSKFYNQECISSDKVDTEAGTIVVEPSTNSVTITWPTEDNAYHYVIEIKKDDEVFCTLTFNADGQLLNIAFAPSRSGSHPVTYAASTGNGLRFTVTSLEESTTYGYDITTKDDEEKILSTYTGEFTTKSNVSTSVSDIQSPMTDCQKLLRNGQLVIVRDGVEYNAMGQEM